MCFIRRQSLLRAVYDSERAWAADEAYVNFYYFIALRVLPLGSDLKYCSSLRVHTSSASQARHLPQGGGRLEYGGKQEYGRSSKKMN